MRINGRSILTFVIILCLIQLTYAGPVGLREEGKVKSRRKEGKPVENEQIQLKMSEDQDTEVLPNSHKAELPFKDISTKPTVSKSTDNTTVTVAKILDAEDTVVRPSSENSESETMGLSRTLTAKKETSHDGNSTSTTRTSESNSPITTDAFQELNENLMNPEIQNTSLSTKAVSLEKNDHQLLILAFSITILWVMTCILVAARVVERVRQRWKNDVTLKTTKETNGHEDLIPKLTRMRTKKAYQETKEDLRDLFDQWVRPPPRPMAPLCPAPSQNKVNATALEKEVLLKGLTPTHRIRLLSPKEAIQDDF